MSYNKYSVKEALSPDDVFDILTYFSAEPIMYSDHIVCKTICHNHDSIEGASQKLYYYFGTRLFRCFTHCGTFDILELICRVNHVSLDDACTYLVNFFNLQWKIDNVDDTDIIQDQKILNKWRDLSDIRISHDKIELDEIDPAILAHYPRPHILPWEKDNIPKSVCDWAGICYDPTQGAILIPHLDEDGRLVGIRRRTLVEEEKVWGKYRPWQHGKSMYSHPLAFCLYGFYQCKSAMSAAKTAIVFEGEKSALACAAYMGCESSLGVAVCGSSISKYQVDMMKRAGIENMIIAFDADYHVAGDEAWHNTCAKLRKIYERWDGWMNTYLMFDRTGDILHDKMSPTDAGKEAFFELLDSRFKL